MKNLGRPRNIGYQGEALVASLLPGAVHINEVRDMWHKWDVEWSGIRLDVKTTQSNKYPVPAFFGFNTEIDLIFVCMDTSNQSNLRFWLRHSRQGFKHTFTNEIPLKTDELEQAILDCHKNYSQIYIKTVDSM